MPPSLRSVTILDRALSPFEADLLVSVAIDGDTDGIDIRGRLLGPTCPYATTVEVDYALRPLLQPVEGSDLVRRVIIPEPSFWDPVSPFLYRGHVEVWQHGRLIERVVVRHGLRSVRIGAEGVHFNGKHLMLRTVDRLEVLESHLPNLRREGINSLILSPSQHALLPALDRLGFIALVRVNAETDWPALTAAPSLLGWLLRPGQEEVLAQLGESSRRRHCVGWESAGSPVPAGVDFVVGEGPGGPPRLGRGDERELGRIL